MDLAGTVVDSCCCSCSSYRSGGNKRARVRKLHWRFLSAEIGSYARGRVSIISRTVAQNSSARDTLSSPGSRHAQSAFRYQPVWVYYLAASLILSPRFEMFCPQCGQLQVSETVRY